MTKVYVIANPKAGKGVVGAQWEEVLAALHTYGLEPLGDLTQGPGHATELARGAREQGRELVVAVGGDGTVNEVVNGLLAGGPGEDVPTLGIIPSGSGCDYARSFDIPRDLRNAVLRLTIPDPPRAVDVGEVRYRDPHGAEVSRYFVNIAEVGFGPAVLERAVQLPSSLGGLVYLAGFWLALPRFTRPRASIRVGEERVEGGMMNLVVAIGQVFGGGMRIAPGADPADGLFDVQVHMSSKLDYVRSIAKVYRGTHLPHRKVREERAADAEISCHPTVLVEADGEVLGRTPATFRTHAGALRLKG